MKNITLLFLSVMLISCGNDAAPTGPGVGESFDLKYGGSVQIRGTDLTVTFSSVAEDSRCPEGAVCVWEGNAKIILRIGENEAAVNTTLDPKEYHFNVPNERRYTIRLVSVAPYPKIGDPIETGEYVATLIVLAEETL